MKIKKLLLVLVAIISFIFLIISVYYIYGWVKDNISAQIQSDEIQGLKGKDIDFTSLKAKNQDVIAWLTVPGTKIDYPVVQTGNNDYYLTHSFNKSKNIAGWVFADYRNNFSTLDQNNIIYGHGLLSKIMFGDLKETLGRDWQNNPDNHTIELITENQKTRWQVFSTYKIPTTIDYLDTNFDDSEQYKEFLQMIKNRSNYNYETEIWPEDKIITLSTCGNRRTRVVLHAKLINPDTATHADTDQLSLNP